MVRVDEGERGTVMKAARKVLIAGAGGVGRAVGLILRETSEEPLDLTLGDAREDVAQRAAEWIRRGSRGPGEVTSFRLPSDGQDDDFRSALSSSDLLLDCLPGREAPRMAELARDHGLHYANLTEHVAETDRIRRLAEGAQTGFILQTGLAPGVVDVLGHGLLQRCCADWGVESAEALGMRVGALPLNAVAPHYYAFTWSPIGVATEYLKDTHVLEKGVHRRRQALEGIQPMVLHGVCYEEAYTSGGVADLPEALEGRVETLDYKTLRYPGHWRWVREQVETLVSDGTPAEERPVELLRRMERVVPREELDVVVLYAFVQGRDCRGILRRREVVRRIEGRKVGLHALSAIQVTTASGLAESARLLLAGRCRGVVLQSQIAPEEYLAGPFVAPVYDTADVLKAPPA